MNGGRVVGVGYHDTCFRWDISTPQRCIARLAALPALGSITQPGRTLFASRDRFGKWDHFLGPRHVMVAYVVQPKGEQIRRLEVQAHLGSDGEDDLCSVMDYPRRFRELTTRMAVMGVLPSEEPRVVRVDVAVDVEYDHPRDGALVLEALRYARWPKGWYAEWQGPPPYTTVAVKSGRKTVARAYCRNSKTRNEKPRLGKIRFEREHRFEWAVAGPVDDLADVGLAALYWEAVFGEGRASGRVTRWGREVLAECLLERLAAGDVTTAEYEQLLGFLTAESLGSVSRAYSVETARRRRALVRGFGYASSDAYTGTEDHDLDDLMAVPRSAWSESLRSASSLLER